MVNARTGTGYHGVDARHYHRRQLSSKHLVSPIKFVAIEPADKQSADIEDITAMGCCMQRPNSRHTPLLTSQSP